MLTSWSSRLKREGKSWARVRKYGVSSTARLVTQRRNGGHLSQFVQRPSNDGTKSVPATRGRRGRSPRWGAPHPGEAQRDRSWSRPTPPTQHRGTITTIVGGNTSKHEIQAVLTGANRTPLGTGKRVSPALTFDDRDLIQGVPYYDEPMVISVVATEYKIKRFGQYPILVNISQNEIITIELEAVFGEDTRRTIPVVYTIVDAMSSYNIIMGRPALN
ncbi:hypothetical protein CR513_33791, partial [Mucuna pruriens]